MDEDRESADSNRMTLGEHLDELRRRVFRSVIAVIVIFAVVWTFHEEVGGWIRVPLERAISMLNDARVADKEALLAADETLRREEFFVSADPAEKELQERLRVRKPQTLGFGEYFIYDLKVATFFAILIGSPVLLWQMWSFIAAGLYRKERRVVLGYVPISLMLFLAGISFGYFLMVPYGLFFLGRMTPEEVDLIPRMSEYLSLVSTLTLALGVVFQLPILIFGLVRVDLVPRSAFSTYRPHFIVGAFVLSAMLTPPDPITQLMMAVPVIMLFEIGLLAARFAERSPETRISEPGS